MQSVRVDGGSSSSFSLRYGVPQGSVLGPVLFSLYITPVTDIIKSYELLYHCYADDIQIYASHNPADALSTASVIQRFQSCIIDIRRWMSAHSLRLNHAKTELINFISPHQLTRYGRQTLSIDDVQIIPSSSVRCLGVQLDQHLTMEDHVSSILQKGYYHLRNISKARPFLTTDACKAAVQVTVVSRSDYCCSLLAGLTQSQLTRLQRLQNSAARMISATPRRQHITPILLELHWLPCQLRIQFRVLVLVFKCLNHLAPAYLCDLLSIYRPGRSLRSASDTTRLAVDHPTRKVGRTSFRLSAPQIWNELPASIRESPSVDTFKRALKTHFFRSFLI